MHVEDRIAQSKTKVQIHTFISFSDVNEHMDQKTRLYVFTTISILALIVKKNYINKKLATMAQIKWFLKLTDKILCLILF
jgi:hypothetical protein